MENVVDWQEMPSREPHFEPIPAYLNPQLKTALQALGIHQLYSHQVQAINAILKEEANLIVATRTASGKSLCYTLPTLQTALQNEHSRAIYVFPTKALAHDQTKSLQDLIQSGNLSIATATYDGDTIQAQRAKIRRSAQIIITNPDMLHANILPSHTQWRNFFRHLRYIVIDEVHAYRGIFGSHVANVVRRLKRIAHFYGSDPQFICSSATIANPVEHAASISEHTFRLINEQVNGAPHGSKSFILYNPPLVDAELGLRQSTILSAKDAASTLILHNIQTAVFARARNSVELLLSYLRDEMASKAAEEDRKWDPNRITGYRGGYLPLERYKIESGLRDGQIRGVVATNALELGVDIGQLDGVVLTGYPGSIASVWQQAGRAGRRQGHSIALLILSNSPLDQYIANHPHYLFGSSPEHALTNPNNLRLLVKHLACAAFEMPFKESESFGNLGPIGEILEAMEEMGLLHRSDDQYHYLADGEIPHHKFSLRTSGNETVVIQSQTDGRATVIGEVDLESVPHMVYTGAIYMHQAQSYLVEHLDWENRIANVKPFDTDYYTRASISSTIQALTPVDEDRSNENILRAWGDILVSTKATGFRKIKRYSHETLGFGDIELPPIELDTNAYWIIFSEAFAERLFEAGILLRPNDYGPNWQTQRKKALDRDDHTCQMCGATETLLHVHHIRPFREFSYIKGENENYLDANRISNLTTLCPSCHQRAEAGQQSRSGLSGLAYALRNLAPLFLMCDPSDIQVLAESRNPLTGAPTVVIYEQVPAGIGFSEKLYQVHTELFQSTLELVKACACKEGCPACVGPPGEIGPNAKQMTLALLSALNVVSPFNE
ncbi:MAG: DEAD/DEAH box helicase [Chloroflexota bacterium]